MHPACTRPAGPESGGKVWSTVHHVKRGKDFGCVIARVLQAVEMQVGAELPTRPWFRQPLLYDTACVVHADRRVPALKTVSPCLQHVSPSTNLRLSRW